MTVASVFSAWIVIFTITLALAGGVFSLTASNIQARSCLNTTSSSNGSNPTAFQALEIFDSVNVPSQAT